MPVDERHPPVLPEDQEFWTPADLALLLHLSRNAVTYHCRHLLHRSTPRRQYRLDRATAMRVVRYIEKFRRKDR